MQVGILTSPRDASEHFDVDAADNPKPSLDRYLPEHHLHYIEIRNSDFEMGMKAVSQKNFDVVVNLCDGGNDEHIPGIEVVRYLENATIAFTGAASAFYDPTREEMKQAAANAGVATPRSLAVHSMTEITHPVLSTLAYPLIVKHPHSYNSIGLTRASRVADDVSMRHELDRMISAFGGALIEEFIDGREFTVLVTEPRLGEDLPWVFTPHEVGFPIGETFKHFDLKWKHYADMTLRPIPDETLSGKLKDASIAIFQHLNGNGYARLDFRMNAMSELIFLEINPNCTIFMATSESFGCADTILAHDGAHQRFARHILDKACARSTM